MTQVSDLLSQLEAATNGRLLEAHAKLSELITANNRLDDENERLKIQNNDLCTQCKLLSESTASLTSQAEHWKREFEKADMLAKAYERKAKRGGSCVADIQAAIDAYAKDNSHE